MKIDPEFRSLIPPLSADEYSQLRGNILTEGRIRDSLVVWAEEGILLDGHNRHEISQELGISFEIKEISLPSRYAAINWIIDNQLGRRNLTPDQISYLRGKRYWGEKKEEGRPEKLGQSDQVSDGSTAKKLAEEYSVGERTIRRDAAYAEAVDSLAETLGPEVRGELLSGDLPVTRKAAIEWSRLDEDTQEEIAGELATGEFNKRTAAQLIVQSSSNEWYTPQKYVESARRVLGEIDVDPASSPSANTLIRASIYYTEETDGLKQDWLGRVWLNPPYGGNAQKFAARLIEQYEAGIVLEAVLLVNSHATDTNWFQPLWDHILCFTDHRIDFESPSGKKSGSTHGSVFVYFGDKEEEFISEFEQYGAVVKRAKA